MNPRALHTIQVAAKVLVYYLITAFAIQLAMQAVSWWRTGMTTDPSLWSTVTLPIAMLFNLPDPLNVYAPYDGDLRLPVYATLILGLPLLAWVTLARHDILNPYTMLRDPQDLPLERRLRPKLRDVGIWRKHDALRHDPLASPIDKAKVFITRFIPGMDPARTATRGNGMLVPFKAEQPAARIYLGTVKMPLWIRKKKFNVYARPEHHVVVYGPSGAGKGASQMNPSLLFWNGSEENSLDGFGTGWPGPLITSTVKNDHVDVSLEWRLSLSEECYIYDPMQLFPEYKQYWVGWDPLSQIRSFSDANRVAAALMESEQQQSGGGGSGNEEYFRAQALMVLAPMLLSAAIAKRSFRTVYEWSMTLDGEATNPEVVGADGEVSPTSIMYQALDPLYEYQDRTGDSTPLNQLNQVFAKAEQEASGVWGSVRKSLQPYNDEKSVMSTSGSTMPRMLDPEKFFTTPHATLYVIAPQVATESKRMRPVFAAFLTWLIEQAQNVAGARNGKLPYPVLANLDEVKNVGALPGLAHTLSLTRSIGFFVKHAWQDDAQIESAYGKDDAKTIVSNSRTWVILPGMSDSAHLDQLANLLGERKVWGKKKKGENSMSERVKAGSASMIKELKDGQVLIITDNLPPFVIDANRYYLDKIMYSRFELGNDRRKTGQMPDPQQLRRLAAGKMEKEEHVISEDFITRKDSHPGRKPLAATTSPAPPPAAEPSDYFKSMQAQLRARQAQNRPADPFVDPYAEDQDPPAGPTWS